LQYIAHLLAHPGREIHVADLATGGVGPDNNACGREGMAAEGDLGAVLDPRAMAEYRRRLADLREDLDEATGAGDAGRAERARHEIELITRELSGAYGLGGRARTAGDPAERVWKAVTNQIRRRPRAAVAMSSPPSAQTATRADPHAAHGVDYRGALAGAAQEAAGTRRRPGADWVD
jgi:hypothetical protein